MIQVARPGQKRSRYDVLDRARRRVHLDLKTPEGRTAAYALVRECDVVIEGLRPGVMERLGLGPEELKAVNPGLIYTRVTGYGQRGPLSRQPGHDLNYLAVAGALEPIGRAGDAPVPPLNLIGDFAGGMLAVVGVLRALHERGRTGRGQVVDAAIVDGTALLMANFLARRARWPEFHANPRGHNRLDSGAYFYEVYECQDGGYLSVACTEPKFHARFLDLLQIEFAAESNPQGTPERWAAMKEDIAKRMRTRTRDDWCEYFAGQEVCVSGVLRPEEATTHPANSERGVYIECDGVYQPAPAPRFSNWNDGAARDVRGGTDADVADILATWTSRAAT